MNDRQRVRVLLVDDDPFARASISAALVDAGYDVTQANDGEAAVDLVERSHPDIVVMDIMMPPGISGIEATRRIVERDPRARVLMFSVHSDDEVIAAAMSAGATSYVTKQAPLATVLDAIAGTVDGLAIVAPPPTPAGAPRPARRPVLTGRAQEIAGLAAAGLTAKQISEDLTISPRTVEHHLRDIYGRLGINSRAQLVVAAAEGTVITDRSARLTRAPSVAGPEAGVDEPRDEPWSRLTERERIVAHHAGHALTNQQIAARLRISPHTVNFHLRQVFRKTGVNSRVELARLIQESSPLDPAVITAHEREQRLAPPAGRPPRPAVQPVIGLVTTLPEEFAAMATLIDDGQERAIAGDPAEYICGTIPSAVSGQPHPVVLTMVTDSGANGTATAAANMLRSFESVDQVVMVGVAAGVPAPHEPQRHVRLGDVVVATRGLVDYEDAVDEAGGGSPRQRFARPSALLAHRAKVLMADELMGRRPWEDELDRLLERLPGFARPDPATDRLYLDNGPDTREIQHPNPVMSGHREGQPKVHQGRIGSAGRLPRDAGRRDALAHEHDLRAFEMEGSGIGLSAFADGRDWLAVRGISDYREQRVGSLWRPYAAAAAAAYTSALLRRCPPISPPRG